MTRTVSRILFGSRNESERQLLMKWCDIAAEGGGTFSIDEEWSKSQWYQVFTIDWPDGVTPDEESA